MRSWLITCVILSACGAGSPAGGAIADVSLTDIADVSLDTADSCSAGAPCPLHNEFGTCSGVTVCGGGSATCSGAAPAPETCNQKDDDCNGLTDDNVCEDGDPATTGYCVGSQCAQKPACDDGDACTADTWTGSGCTHSAGGGCSIAGVCQQAGTKAPGDPCKVCNPLQSKTNWVSQPGLTCDDGDACTTGDACSDGSCHGTPLDCSSQGTACGAATCVAGKCVVSGSGGACKPGDVAACSDPCQTNTCGADCAWQGCALKAGAKCAYQAGNDHQCCAKGSWQFCSKTTCDWYPCQADTQSGCP